jgi:hypothetical protein
LSSELRLLVACVLALACADLERGPAAATGMNDAGLHGDAVGPGAGVGFHAVRALLVRDCASCHAAGKEAGRSALVLGMDAALDLEALRPLVDQANPAGSRLASKATGLGHGGGSIWAAGSPEHATLLSWIRGGALP